jgi:hypothetical protein
MQNDVEPTQASPIKRPDTSSQSQSYFTADGRSVSMSWCRAYSGTFHQILLPVKELRSAVAVAEEDEMGGTCTTNGGKRNAHRLLVGTPVGRSH